MIKNYICRKKSNRSEIEIFNLSEEELNKLISIVENYYNENNKYIKNEYSFCKNKNDELMWKFTDIGYPDVWYPLDRLPVDLEKIIKKTK